MTRKNIIALHERTFETVKKWYPFPSCRYKNQLIKKGTLFHLLQTNVIAHYRSLRRNFHLQKSFHKPIFGILNRFDIDKKGRKIKASPFGDEH